MAKKGVYLYGIEDLKGKTGNWTLLKELEPILTNKRYNRIIE